MKFIFSILCITLLVQCGPIEDLNIIKQSKKDSDAENTAAPGDLESRQGEEPGNESSSDEGKTEEQDETNTEETEETEELGDLSEEQDKAEEMPENDSKEVPTVEQGLKEVVLQSDRVLLGGGTNVFNEENAGCAQGELRNIDNIEDLDLEIKVHQATEFVLTLEKVCGLDYEGAKIIITNMDDEIVYEQDLEIGMKEYRFPQKDSKINFGEGIYDLKISMGKKDVRGPLGIFVLSQDIDSVSVGEIKLSLNNPEDVSIFGDFTTE